MLFGHSFFHAKRVFPSSVNLFNKSIVSLWQDGKKYRLSEVYKFHALITTYELVLSDAEVLRDIKWRLVIIDEAHRLKNQKCRLLNELKTLDLGQLAVCERSILGPLPPLPLPPKRCYFISSYPTHLFGSG